MRCTTELTNRFNLVINPGLDLDNLGSYYDDDGNFCVPDVLDMNTVSFERVEDALSLELYEQDLAEDRAYEDFSDEFEFEFDWGDAGRNDNYDKYLKRVRAEKKKADERRNKISLALVKAQEMYPGMNWERLVSMHNAGFDVFTKEWI